MENFKTPITDIRIVVNNAEIRGINFVAILISKSNYYKVISSDEFKDLRWYNKYLCRFKFYCNIVMRLNRLPKLRVVTKRINVEYES